MRKIIKWGLIIFVITFFISIVVSVFSDFTPEDNLDSGIRNYNKGDYEMAESYFLDIKPEDSLYNKAQNYIKKIDSISKITAIKDSINSRTEAIKKQFSSWDGAHKNLEKSIKKGMNDPNSYEHIKTVYRDLTDKLLITTTFRGENAFGGTVTNSISAYVDLSGNIIEFINQ